ncbi:hypothetical protein DVK02_11150 [Halobellus sp. Atlit-31R]|nr:hypothetical protein DVK02_11150 [Halobellus sp. Atlit-31R]
MPRDESLSLPRRPLMKALGAGGALSAFAGSTVAREAHGREAAVESEDDDANSTGTVHTVETLIRAPATNPNRPVDFFFQPTGLYVQPGDVVKFVFRTPDHNVVAYHPAFGMRRRVPVGVTAFSSPLLGWRPESIPGEQIEPPAEMGGDGGESGGEQSGADTEAGSEDGPVPDTWLHAFETPGVYDLLCSPHESFGMAIRVVVGDVTETQFETANPDALPEPRAGPVGLARAVLTDPSLLPETVVSEGSIPWEALEANQGNGS